MNITDYLKVAKYNYDKEPTEENELYYNFFLMESQDYYHNKKFNDCMLNVIIDLESVTGCVYGECFLPIIYVGNKDSYEVTDNMIEQYNKLVADGTFIKAMANNINTFAKINKLMRLMLSTYVFKAKHQFGTDLHDTLFKYILKQANSICIDKLQDSYVRHLFMLLIDVYNTLLYAKNIDCSSYLYLTKGVVFENIDITAAIQEVYKLREEL